jgi:hypothetical protein
MPAINNLPAPYESMKGNGGKKYKSSINNDSSSLSFEDKDTDKDTSSSQNDVAPQTQGRHMHTL